MPGSSSDSILFLPITAAHVESLCATEADFTHELLEDFTIYELAVALLITTFSAFRGLQNYAIESAWGEISYAVGEPGADRELLVSQLLQKDVKFRFKLGVEMMDELNIKPMSEDMVLSQSFLREDRSWDYDFRSRLAGVPPGPTMIFETDLGRELGLNSDQARVFQRFKLEPDEHMDIQALAGTGKTYLAHGMLECLVCATPLVLTLTHTQLLTLRNKVGQSFNGMTFGALAGTLLEQDQTKPQRRPGNRANLNYNLSDGEVAKRMGFQPVGNLSPARVANLCRRAIMSFCYSRSAELTAEHIPDLDVALSQLQVAVLVEYSNQYWQQIIEPTDRALQLPIRGYHRIKHASLLPDLKVDSYYSHIIVDESHDLTGPMIVILDRSDQPTITMGDACQRMDAVSATRAMSVRKTEVTHSMRAGRQIEDVINPLIDIHPRSQTSPMTGSPSLQTRISYYDKVSIPDKPTTILVRSQWGLFEWFQRLGAANVRFGLLEGARRDFSTFMQDCIGLYHEGTPPRHRALFRHSTWQSLAQANDKSRAFRKVQEMLERGYSYKNFEASYSYLDSSSSAPYMLGRVEDARNMEMDSVMLSPDLMAPINPSYPSSAINTLSTLYVGSSRARFELIVPGHLRDWLQDQARHVRKA